MGIEETGNIGIRIGGVWMARSVTCGGRRAAAAIEREGRQW